MNNYYVVSDELCHYGVIGMKWGQHKLNSYDKKSTGHLARALIAARYASEYASKGVKKLKKYDNDYTKAPKRVQKKLDRLERQIKKQASNAKKHMAESKKIDSLTYKKMADLVSNGHNVSRKTIKRNGDPYFKAIALLGGPTASTAYAMSELKKYKNTNGEYPWAISGNKYKVR